VTYAANKCYEPYKAYSVAIPGGYSDDTAAASMVNNTNSTAYTFPDSDLNTCSSTAYESRNGGQNFNYNNKVAPHTALAKSKPGTYKGPDGDTKTQAGFFDIGLSQ
jgi:hypothetical protein